MNDRATGSSGRRLTDRRGRGPRRSCRRGSESVARQRRAVPTTAAGLRRREAPIWRSVFAGDADCRLGADRSGSSDRYLAIE